MKTLLRTEGTRTSFIITDLDPAYAEVAQALYYEETEAGFAKTLPPILPISLPYLNSFPIVQKR
jgi:hypothetical protein